MVAIKDVDKRFAYLQEVINDISLIVNGRSSAEWIPDVDIERDRSEIMAFYLTNRKNSALPITNPEIAAERDYSRNGMLPV